MLAQGHLSIQCNPCTAHLWVMTLTSSDLPMPMVFLLGIVTLFVITVLLWLTRYYLSGERSQNIQWADIWPNILFILIFSGPPMLRARDPLASIRGDVDYV